MTTRPKIVVVGSSNTDLVVRVAAIPQPGETVLGGDVQRVAGGKGANQAVAAQRAGVAVRFIGCLGRDSFGDEAAAVLAAEGMDLTYLVRVPDAPSGVALITVAANGQNSIVVAPGANARLHPDAIIPAALTDAHMVIAQLETPLATVQQACSLARAAGIPTLLNPAPAPPLPTDLLALTDVLVCNETEATSLTGVPVSDVSSATTALRALLAHGPRLVVVTLGSAGALLGDAQEVQHIAAYRVAAVDTTAAGDAFIGAFACRLVTTGDSIAATRYATAAAALAVGHAGAQPSLPTADAITAFLAADMIND